MESKINKSNFLKKYKKQMVETVSLSMPDVDKEVIEEVVDNMIKERLRNPKVTLDNNFTGESRDSTLLSVLDWTFDRKPIIAGNGTFYKNQYEAINPIAKMLEGFLTKRKAYKKAMFKIDDVTSSKYRDLDLLQSIEKVNANSYYGASGAQSSAFYSLWSAGATTLTAQSVISTAETLFEGFVADNYLFLNLTELLEWCRKALKQFHDDDNGYVDDEIERQYQNDLLDRLLKKIIDKKGSDEEILDNYLSSLTGDEITILYYKNNMQDFIDKNQFIKDLFISIFESIENLSYAREDEKDWFINKVPNEYREDFIGKTYDKWNKFVNKQYFMDPNDPPKVIENYLIVLNDFIRKYVYCRYLSVDRVYRLKNFDRKVVTVIDTDSNILSLDTIIDYILDNIIKDRTFGRDFTSNIFIAINTLAYVLTSAVSDILQTYGEYSNVPEEFRPIYSMKNEFLFMRLIIGETKKRYMSKIVLREGNLISPAKYDIKGFDFKKATCSEFAEDFFMSLIKKHIINSEKIEVKEMLQGINEFKIQIKESIQRGERTYLPNASAKEMNAYKNPESEQSVRGVLVWNYLFPENRIDVPTKVSLLKLNIFKEEDIEDLKTTEPEYYNIIIDKIFNDTTGIFVTSKWEFDTIDYVNVNNKEWYNNIPKKYRSKYKKLGPDAWNEFVDKHVESNPFDDGEEGHYETKKRGMQVIAIPSNATIPSWLNPYIDYSTMINTILAPFVPVLEIFKEKTVEEGKTINGVNRKTAAITNIIKF